MPVEMQVLLINALCLFVAYFLIFPNLKPLTLNRMAVADLFIGAIALGTVAALFWGSGQEFRLLVFQTNWFWYFLVMYVAMELILFGWFMRRHGLRLDGD